MRLATGGNVAEADGFARAMGCPCAEPTLPTPLQNCDNSRNKKPKTELTASSLIEVVT